jgi:peptidoglycan hydrolase CwlO-like protein
MNLVDLLKKNIVMIPVVASVLVGTFTGVRYIVNLTDTINSNQLAITNLQRDLEVAEKNITDINTRLSTWQMAENLYRQLADQVREHSYDIKDLNREINY